MVLPQQNVTLNNYTASFEKHLPMFSLIIIGGIGIGVIFGVYYAFISYDPIFSLVYFIAILIGFLSLFYVEKKTREIENIENDNRKGED